ncbi:MAG: hypothetical protein WD894_10315 [Pirellulales bacterium]
MRSACRFAALLLLVAGSSAVFGPVAKSQEARRRASAPEGYRRLVPGVVTTIPIQWDPGETVSFPNIVELVSIPGLNWTPQTISKAETLAAKATRVAFRRDVWNLEFSFLPMRMVAVDVPQPGGKMRRTMIWYLVYRVTNQGGHLHPERQADGTPAIKKVDHPVTFIPSFTLYNPELRKSYLDKIIPVAMGPIRAQEDPRRKLLNSAEMMEQPIQVSTETEDNSVWGLATWESGFESGDLVDPRTDYFSIYVDGLSNAYKFADPPAAYKAGEPPAKGRLYYEKMLQLNFWRPSDEFSDAETDIYLGAPSDLGIRGRIDYQWVFR